MSMIGIVLATVIVGGTGLFIGIFLGLADKKFAVEGRSYSGCSSR